MKTPITNLIEQLLKMGHKVKREDFYEINIEKTMTVNLNSDEVIKLKRLFGKYFIVSETQIKLK